MEIESNFHIQIDKMEVNQLMVFSQNEIIINVSKSLTEDFSKTVGIILDFYLNFHENTNFCASAVFWDQFLRNKNK